MSKKQIRGSVYYGFLIYHVFVLLVNIDNVCRIVRVEDGQIKISGTIEKRSDDKGKNTNSSQYYRSTFHRSFPVPYGVDGDRVQMEQDGEKIIIKLPKVK